MKSRKKRSILAHFFVLFYLTYAQIKHIATLRNLSYFPKRILNSMLLRSRMIYLVERSSTEAIPTVISQYHNHHHPP